MFQKTARLLFLVGFALLLSEAARDEAHAIAAQIATPAVLGSPTFAEAVLARLPSGSKARGSAWPPTSRCWPGRAEDRGRWGDSSSSIGPCPN